MEIVEVLDKKEIEIFHSLPFYIYKEDENWIPHLKQDVEAVFDESKNKSFRNGGKIRRWLAFENGKCIGRIAAFVNPKYSKGMEQETGGIGFFESIDNEDVAYALFDCAINWLKEEGMQAVDGPINFGEKDRFWGLLVKNFTFISSYAMNYNPPYYQKFFEDYGFQTYYNQHVYSRDMSVPAQEVFVRKHEKVMADPDYRIANVQGLSFDEITENFRTVYNNAWGGHHGFKKLTALQAKASMKALKPVIDREIIIFVYHKEKPVAFYVNIPELNEIFRYVNGNLNWLGKLKFLYHKWRKTGSIMVGLVFGVDREYHGKGIEGAMIKWASDKFVGQSNYKRTVLTWIGDFNPKMMHIAESLGAEQFRSLKTYRKLFDENAEFKRAPEAG